MSLPYITWYYDISDYLQIRKPKITSVYISIYIHVFTYIELCPIKNICLGDSTRNSPQKTTPRLESVLLEHVGVRHHRAGRNDAPR